MMKEWKPNSADFKKRISELFDSAYESGQDSIVILARTLHEEVGGYPGTTNHRMPVCCRVMWQHKQVLDEVVHEPPKKAGASLEIRYRLPR